MFSLYKESSEDELEVEVLFDAAFGPGRLALSSYSLRQGVRPAEHMSTVIRDDAGSLCGAIRFWPISVGKHVALLLGPVAVHQTRQGEGLGGLLIRDGIMRAREQGWHNILLIGDEPYYARFGFVRAAQIQFPPPTDPNRILILNLDYSLTQNISGKVSKLSIASDAKSSI